MLREAARVLADDLASVAAGSPAYRGQECDLVALAQQAFGADAEAIARKWLAFRYRLIPYLGRVDAVEPARRSCAAERRATIERVSALAGQVAVLAEQQALTTRQHGRE